MPELKLLPCPFCGGEAEIVTSSVYWDAEKEESIIDGYYVICSNDSCPVMPSLDCSYDTQEEAAKAWNTRADHIADINKMVCWCKDCKHYAEYEGVCTNADSEWVADFRSQYDSCKNFELKCHDNDTTNVTQ